jgi:hypothetical protein
MAVSKEERELGETILAKMSEIEKEYGPEGKPAPGHTDLMVTPESINDMEEEK